MRPILVGSELAEYHAQWPRGSIIHDVMGMEEFSLKMKFFKEKLEKTTLVT